MKDTSVYKILPCVTSSDVIYNTQELIQWVSRKHCTTHFRAKLAAGRLLRRWAVSHVSSKSLGCVCALPEADWPLGVSMGVESIWGMTDFHCTQLQFDTCGPCVRAAPIIDVKDVQKRIFKTLKTYKRDINF